MVGAWGDRRQPGWVAPALLAVAVAVFALAVAAPAQAAPDLGYRSMVLADQPTGYWPLDAEALGADVAPGGSHPGLAGSSVAPGLPGIRGGESAAFPGLDGDAGRVTIANTAGLRGDAAAGAITVEAWIKANDVGTSTTSGPLVTVLGNEGPSPNAGFGIRIRENGSIWFFIGGVGYEYARTLTPANAVKSGQWFHYVGTYDGFTPRLYLDGQLMPNVDGSPPGQVGARITSAAPLVLGGHVGGGEPLDGNLDEVAVYDHVLSAADVARHYAAGINGAVVPLDDVSVSAEPGHAAAGAEDLPVGDLGTSSLVAGDATTLAAAPLRSTPLRSTPLRSTPLRSTPLRSTPLRSTPLRSTPLSAIPLRSTPLRSTGWADVLEGTPLADAPLNAVTLEQVFALNSAAVDALTLADIDLDASPLRSTSLGALMLGDLKLSDLGPTDGVCAALGAAAPCDDLLNKSLAELELEGRDLTPYYRLGLPLPAGKLAGTPLATIALTDVGLAATPLGALPAADFAGILACGTTCAGTLGDQSPAALGTATLGGVFGKLPPEGMPNLTLASLLRGIVPAEELPLGLIPITDLLRRAPLRTTDLVTVSVGFTVDCAVAGGLRVDVPVPPGLRYVPGSARLAGGPDVEDPQDLGDTLSFTKLADGGDLAGVCGGGQTSTASLGAETHQLQFSVEPPAKLGVLALQARVRVDSAAADAEPGSLTVDDGHDAPSDTRGAAMLSPGAGRTGYISAPDDVDTYAIHAPQTGSRVAVTLSHLPADYDVSVLGPPTGLDAVPLRSTPLRSTPLRSTPLLDQGAEPGAAPRTLAPQTLQDAPLRSTPLRSTPLRSTSMNRGRADESASFVVEAGDVDQDFYVQVAGHNGAASPSPYLLSVRVTPPVPAPQCVGPRTLRQEDHGTLPATLPSATQTLFLVNRQRLAQLYSPEQADDVIAHVQAVADMRSVAGAVVPVDGSAAVRDAYAALEADRCSVAAANHVAESINAVVDDLRDGLAGLRHIVLVGGDDVLPQVRVRDQVSLSNEREEADELVFGGRDNAVSRALREGYVLTDDPYGDFDPQAWLSGELFVPDVGLGRLVETPEEITGQLDQFVQSDGVLDPQTAEVSGYDFLSDGATEVLDQLRGAVGDANARGDINDTWTADNAIASLNRLGGGFTSINAHYDHYRALPASAFSGSGAPNLLSAAQANPQPGSVLFTMGCHAGLSVPDTAVGSATDRPAALLDWSQRFAASRAVFVANTGYGYGDTEAVAWSERIMSLLAGQLASRRVTAGQALMFAKQRFMADTGVPGVYDAKASQEATFYGLPMYRIGTGGQQGAAVLPSDPSGGQDPALSDRFDVTPDMERIRGDRGTHWEVTGEAPQVTHFRPIQPRTDIDVTAADGRPVHGAIVDTLASTDIGGVDPVYSRPTIDLAAREPEISARSDVFPASIQRVATLGTPGGMQDRLVLVTGQFFTDPGSASGRGTQRLFTRIAGEVLRSSSTDFDAPALRDVTGEIAGNQAAFTVRSPDGDALRGVVLYRDDAGGAAWRQAPLSGTGGVFTASGPVGAGATEISEFTVQLADTSGNVAVASNKGRGYAAAAAPPPGVAPLTFEPEAPATGIYRTGPEVVIGDGGSVEGYTVRIDDGPFLPYARPLFIQGDGLHTITVKSPDGQTAQRTVRVDGTAPMLAETVPTGWQSGPVSVDLTATDPAGGSGVESLTYSVAGGAPVTVDGGRAQVVVDGEGVTPVTYRATDRAGNESEPKTVEVKIDATPPTATHQISPAPRNGYNRADVTVTITGEDAGSGVEALLVARDGRETEYPGRTAVIELTGSATLSYRARDVAGRVSEPRTVEVRIDRAKPTAQHSVTPAAPASGWYREPATVSITAADAGSGVDGIVYEASGGQRIEPTTVSGSSAAVTIAQDGITTVTYRAIDAAGNESDPQTVTLKVDRTAPALTCTPDRPYLWPPDLRLYPVNVALRVSDAASGPAGLKLASLSSNGLLFLNAVGFDVGTPDTAGYLRALPALLTFEPRTYRLAYEARDVAGNVARCEARVLVARPPR